MIENQALEIPLKRFRWPNRPALALTQPRKILIVHAADGGSNVEYQDGSLIFIPMSPDTVIKKVNKYMRRFCGRRKKNLRLSAHRRSGSFYRKTDPLCA